MSPGCSSPQNDLNSTAPAVVYQFHPTSRVHLHAIHYHSLDAVHDTIGIGNQDLVGCSAEAIGQCVFTPFAGNAWIEMQTGAPLGESEDPFRPGSIEPARVPGVPRPPAPVSQVPPPPLTCGGSE